MVRCVSKFIAFYFLLLSLTQADDRVYFESEDERRWNTPPKLTPEPADGKSNLDNDSPQPRFLPFSASFTLSAGGASNNAHSLSVGSSQDGISFSQSVSQAGNSFGNEGSGISASQSSSFSAGLSGISAADSNSFNLNHPAFGGNSEANSNSFALGQATSSAHGNVLNGKATSGAQSSVGSSQSSASSGAQSHRQSRPMWTNIGPNYEVGGLYNPNTGGPKLHVTQGSNRWNQKSPGRGPLRLDVGLDDDRWQHRRPEVLITNYRPSSGYNGHRQEGSLSGSLQSSASSENRETWTQNPLTGPDSGTWSQSQGSSGPALQIAGASASSSAISNSPGGSSFGQSSSHSGLGQQGSSSWTTNKVQTSGNANSQAQGAAAAVGQNFNGNTQGSFSSGAIAGSSQGVGHSQGIATSGNRNQNSRGQVTSQAHGTASVQGTSNSGSVSFVKFPGDENRQNIPKEFVRSQQRQASKAKDPFSEIFTDITDTVADLFDY